MSDSRSKPPASTTPQAALDALLAGGAGGNPIRRALWLDELDRRLRPFLPPSLTAHARLANIDGGRLVFLVDSPVWHARLRLAANDLLDAARSIGLDVNNLVVKTTRQMPGATMQPEPVALSMSTTARDALRDAVASLRESGEVPEKKDGS
jgi:hypothetical protein